MDRKQTRAKSRRTKSLIKGITNEQLVQILEQLAETMGIQVRHEKGEFHSAGCRVEEQNLIILKKSDQNDQKAKALLGELAKLETQNIDIPQDVQDLLSIFREQTAKGISAV